MQSRTFKQEKAKDEAFQPAAGKPINRVSGAFSVDDQSRTIHDAPVSQAHLQGHIDLIAKHEQEFWRSGRQRSEPATRFATFVGSFLLLELHILAFLFWIGRTSIPNARRFNLAPFRCLELWLRSKPSSWPASF